MFQRDFKWGEVDRAFEEADQVFTETFRWNRMGANPMETGGVIGQWDPVEGSATLRGPFQLPAQQAMGLSPALGLPLNKVNLISHHMGGCFGGKGGHGSSEISVLLSRKAGGRPVKWIQDRTEYMVGGSSQAWDRHYELSLAVKNDGTVTGLRVKLLDDMGATGQGHAAVGAIKPMACFSGCYAIPSAEYDLTLVATNKLPTAAYRGMGPPPHNCVLELMMDIAARGLGMDPTEIRRKNFIPPDRFPYTIVSGNEYDSGEYEAALDKTLEMADYRRLRQEQAEARKQGRYLGIGVANAVEPGVFDYNLFGVMGWGGGTGPPEGVKISIDLMGKVVIKLGWPSGGQGQYTLAAQLAADYLGVDLEDVRIVRQDTLSAPSHFGPGGSRLGVAMTGAVLGAAGQLKEKLIKVAARLLETEPEKVELMDGKLRVEGVAGAELPMAQVAATMRMRPDLLPPDVEPNPEATAVWTAPNREPLPDEQGRVKSYLTAANACHVVSLELDPETGQAKILGYWIADDCGTRLNPANVEGMTDGGTAQGVGAALMEQYVYDEEGQPLVSTLMDYPMPTIHDVPWLQKEVLVTPSPFTPLGAKGVGEGALHTAPAAVMCAINDALAPLGVWATEVPATPNRLWELIRQAKRHQ
jgi:CO/xanthine dehydrogenase Mo-binding subunit